MSCKVTPRARGPLCIEGDFVVLGLDGEAMELDGQKRVLLCRCGGTKRAPICDGTHYRNGFEAPPANADDVSSEQE